MKSDGDKQQARITNQLAATCHTSSVCTSTWNSFKNYKQLCQKIWNETLYIRFVSIQIFQILPIQECTQFWFTHQLHFPPIRNRKLLHTTYSPYYIAMIETNVYIYTKLIIFAYTWINKNQFHRLWLTYSIRNAYYIRHFQGFKTLQVTQTPFGWVRAVLCSTNDIRPDSSAHMTKKNVP